MKAESVCRLVLPGVHTGLIFLGSIVHTACPKPLGKGIFCTPQKVSLYSQVLLLPIGVPPMAAPAMLHLQSHDREVWRALTTTDVGNVTQARGSASRISISRRCAVDFVVD